MTETLILAEHDPGVMTVTLNRPQVHNALDATLITALHQAADDLAKSPATRVVVLEGAGPSFCAGGDLNWMRDQMQADAQTRRVEAERLAHMLQAWNSLTKPVIAKIHGSAFGGGVGLAAVADVAVAADSARFGLTETRLGLIPATIGPYVLARMGEGKARRVFMSSRRFCAAEACALDLVARVVSADDLSTAVAEEVTPYLSCAPGAVAAAKALARRLGPPIGPAEIAASIDALIAQWDGDEAAEGVAAFFEKRSPNWAKTAR